MGKQTLRQAARLAASEVCAKRRREPAERDGRLEKLAIEVLTALEERDVTTIAATEQRAHHAPASAAAGPPSRHRTDQTDSIHGRPRQLVVAHTSRS
jgi:hypothetical protein